MAWEPRSAQASVNCFTVKSSYLIFLRGGSASTGGFFSSNFFFQQLSHKITLLSTNWLSSVSTKFLTFFDVQWIIIHLIFYYTIPTSLYTILTVWKAFVCYKDRQIQNFQRKLVWTAAILDFIVPIKQVVTSSGELGREPNWCAQRVFPASCHPFFVSQFQFRAWMLFSWLTINEVLSETNIWKRCCEVFPVDSTGPWLSIELKLFQLLRCGSFRYTISNRESEASKWMCPQSTLILPSCLRF